VTSMTNVLEPIERALRRARQREDSRNRDTLYFPAAYERDLHLALAETAQKTVDRIIICSTESPDANAFHRTIWRDVAASGPVSRAVYVLSHTGLIRSALTELVKLDVEAGISVRIVAVGDLPDSVALATVTEQFWSIPALPLSHRAGKAASRRRLGQLRSQTGTSPSQGVL